MRKLVLLFLKRLIILLSLLYFRRNSDKLRIKYQSHPKPKKLNAFEQTLQIIYGFLTLDGKNSHQPRLHWTKI